MFNLCCTFII